MNFSDVLKNFGGGKTLVVTARACLGILLLSTAVPARALDDGIYTVTEKWTVKLQTKYSSPQTYQGTEIGQVGITNGHYRLIDHTGIAGGDTNNTQVHTLAGGPPYTSTGEYPYAGWALSTNGVVNIMHLGFFSVGIVRATPDNGPLVASNSAVFTITGNSLAGLTGSGKQNNEGVYYFTASSASSLAALSSKKKSTNSVPTNTPPPAPFFMGQTTLANNWYFLTNASNTNVFGYYNLGNFPTFYHNEMGFEYFFDANNSAHGCYLYDYSSKTFFYTEPAIFPSLYDFTLNTWVWYYPDTTKPGHYTTNPRWFYNWKTSAIFSK